MNNFIVILILSSIVGISSAFFEDSNVVIITKDNFSKNVVLSEKPWSVMFFAPWCGHCQHFKGDYSKAADNLKNIAGVGAVNCDEEKELCSEFKITGFPTVKIFPGGFEPAANGSYEKESADYQGPRTASGVVNAVLGNLADNVFKASGQKDADRLAKTNANSHITFLFSDKPTTPTLFKSLALDFKYNGVFYLISHTDEYFVNKYEVKEFPTVIISKKNGELARFSGKVNYDNLFRFFSEHIGKPAPSPYTIDGFKVRDAGNANVTRIVSQDDFDEGCIAKKRICFLAVLDPLNNAYRQESDEKILQSLASKYRGRSSFLWFGALEQPEAVKQLALNGGYPAIVAFYTSKNRYAIHVGKFDESSLDLFVSNVLSGTVRANEYDELPKFVSVNPSDFLFQQEEDDEDDDIVLNNEAQEKKEL